MAVEPATNPITWGVSNIKPHKGTVYGKMHYEMQCEDKEYPKTVVVANSSGPKARKSCFSLAKLFNNSNVSCVLPPGFFSAFSQPGTSSHTILSTGAPTFRFRGPGRGLGHAG